MINIFYLKKYFINFYIPMKNITFYFFFINFLLAIFFSNGYLKSLFNKKEIVYKNTFICKNRNIALSLKKNIFYGKNDDENENENEFGNEFGNEYENRNHRKNNNYDNEDNGDDEFEDEQEKKIYNKHREYILRNLIGKNGLGIRVIIPSGYLKNNEEDLNNNNDNNHDKKNSNSDSDNDNNSRNENNNKNNNYNPYNDRPNNNRPNNNRPNNNRPNKDRQYNEKQFNQRQNNYEQNNYEENNGRLNKIWTKKKQNVKSENFELVYDGNLNFTSVGGYDLIKNELLQCSDILVNYTKYSKYNVRIPKGLILEGPPGNGKTLLTKAFCGEIDLGFISTSGSQFQETYVGVGPKRIRELFKLARENKPCIIFIDEIDAVGRKRSSEETSSANAERDSTLNQLLVELDGFKDSNGVFVIGATNRIDLLDSALVRPGRIDKKIYVGNPDKKTREEIIKIHMKNKPIENNIGMGKLVELTNGYSGAEIENLFNEAMLNALRSDREIITQLDVDLMSNRILTGWQITENKLSDEMLLQVAIHEIGHALVGIYTQYKKLVKVSINLWSPKSLGFTLFEESLDGNLISTKEKLIKEIMVLLGGRVAEELFYGEKISSGALDDLNRVKAIIQKMIIDYGMGKSLFIPYNSDKYREKIDEEIELIFNDAYQKTKYLLSNSKLLIKECALILKIENEITEENIKKLMKQNYNYLMINSL